MIATIIIAFVAIIIILTLILCKAAGKADSAIDACWEKTSKEKD